MAPARRGLLAAATGCWLLAAAPSTAQNLPSCVGCATAVVLTDASMAMVPLSGLSVAALPGASAAFSFGGGTTSATVTAAPNPGAAGWYRIEVYLHISAAFDGDVAQLLRAEVTETGTGRAQTHSAAPHDWRDQWQHVEMLAPCNVVGADPSRLVVLLGTSFSAGAVLATGLYVEFTPASRARMANGAHDAAIEPLSGVAGFSGSLPRSAIDGTDSTVSSRRALCAAAAACAAAVSHGSRDLFVLTRLLVLRCAQNWVISAAAYPVVSFDVVLPEARPVCAVNIYFGSAGYPRLWSLGVSAVEAPGSFDWLATASARAATAGRGQERIASGEGWQEFLLPCQPVRRLRLSLEQPTGLFFQVTNTSSHTTSHTSIPLECCASACVGAVAAHLSMCWRVVARSGRYKPLYRLG